MGYVDRTLAGDERVIHRARIHWIELVRGPAVLGIGCWAISATDSPAYWYILPVGLGLFLFLKDLIDFLTTELAVTSNRVIYKAGLIRREVSEIRLSKVESVEIRQTVLGRMLGYGDVIVTGTGSNASIFPIIDDPLSFRRHVVH